METKNPHANGAGASDVVGRYAKPDSTWSGLLASFRLAKAEMDLHCAREPQDGQHEAYEAETSRLCDIHTEALNRLLLTPCRNPQDLGSKIAVIVEEEIHDGWYMASPIMALLTEDARRILILEAQS
ncbi:hypothetical protein [Altericroceibacterium xinjiangense]|uniref:hypothetical protein n=1 Tax=Altericroceibacterium xinjiangense TaxID=762261 RepID=UPI000F7D6F06|nr:hypothetical protein [Altericroceibacterium xinjiangense]